MKLQQKVDTDTKCHQKRCLKLAPDHPQSRYHVCAVANPIWHQELEKGRFAPTPLAAGMFIDENVKYTVIKCKVYSH